MAGPGKNRIGSAKLRFVAPRGASRLQAQADRAARQARTRLARRLDAHLPYDAGYLVIDRLDCPPITVEGSDPMDAVALTVADALTSARAGPGIWRFESEAAYIAAFIAAFKGTRPPTGPQWDGLRDVGHDGPAAALLLLCAKRGVAPLDVLAAHAMRGSELNLLATAAPEIVEALIRLSTPRQAAPESGVEVLVVAAAAILAEAGFPKPDQAKLKQAILAAPLIWSDPVSLADAVARGVFAGGWPETDRAATYLTHPSGAPLPPSVASAIDRFAWLDRTRLTQALENAGLPPVGRTLRRAIALLDRALDDLATEIECVPHDIRVSRQALRLLWQTSLARISPDQARNPVILELIERLTEDTKGPVPAHLSPLRQRWDRVQARWAPAALPNPPHAIPSTGVSAGVKTRTGPDHATLAETRQGEHSQTARPFARRIEPEAAGHLLLWRTLVDLNFRAQAHAVCDQPYFPNRALWTVIQDETGMNDEGAKCFAGILDVTDVPEPITPDEANHLAARLTTAPAVRLSGRSGLGLADTLLSAFAFWLRGYETSSPDFVRKTFLHRSGTLFLSAAHLEVQLEPRPFDLVLRRAGYLASFSAPDWLGGTRTYFSIAEAS